MSEETFNEWLTRTAGDPTRDIVGEWNRRRNATVDVRPSQLLTDEQNAARVAAGPRPTPTGDVVADHMALEAWKRRRNPDPHGLRRS